MWLVAFVASLTHYGAKWLSFKKEFEKFISELSKVFLEGKFFTQSYQRALKNKQSSGTAE